MILGTVQFGIDYGINNQAGKPTPEQVFEILKYAWDAGVNTLDTADAYGNASELIGEFHDTVPYRFRINTKFRIGSESGTIHDQLERSLQVLKVNGIEVYFYHSFQDFVKFPQVLTELRDLKNTGKIEKIGVSVYENDEFKIAIETGGVDVIQIPFNVLDNTSQRGELLRMAKVKGKQIQARSLFLQGLLFKHPDAFPARLAPLKRYMGQFLDITSISGKTVEEVCLAYALGHVEIDQVIIGVDSKDQLLKNINFAHFLLSPMERLGIDAIYVKEEELLYPKNW